MTTMLKEIYAAFREAGVSEEKASSAAEAVANYENRFNKLEKELAIIKWMIGFVLAFCVAIVLKLYS